MRALNSKNRGVISEVLTSGAIKEKKSGGKMEEQDDKEGEKGTGLSKSSDSQSSDFSVHSIESILVFMLFLAS